MMLTLAFGLAFLVRDYDVVGHLLFIPQVHKPQIILWRLILKLLKTIRKAIILIKLTLWLNHAKARHVVSLRAKNKDVKVLILASIKSRLIKVYFVLTERLETLFKN